MKQIQLIKDLANGKVTDNVRNLVFADVTKTRPLTISDMPLQAVENPNMRVWYSLSSWTLKQANFAKNQSLDLMAKPGFANKLRGVKNLITLGTMMGLAGGSVDVVRDFFAGRDIDPRESFLMNMFSFGMGAKFASEAIADGNLPEAVTSIVPVMGIWTRNFNEATKIVRDGDLRRMFTTTSTGRSLFNLFGPGMQQLADDAKEKREAERAAETDPTNLEGAFSGF